MLGPTDGNLYALAQYERKVDAEEALDDAIRSVMDRDPDLTEEDALEILRDERDAAEQDRGEYLAELRAGCWG